MVYILSLGRDGDLGPQKGLRILLEMAEVVKLSGREMRKLEHCIQNSWGYLCTILGVNMSRISDPLCIFMTSHSFLSPLSLLLALILVQFITLLSHSAGFIGLRTKNHFITAKKTYPRKPVGMYSSVRASM